MAFQFRRGTDAQRQTITPAEGEPLYTTDTYALYVGDGSTLGGLIISGGGGSTSTLINGSFTAQLNTDGQLNVDQFLAKEGGVGINPGGHYAGYSFQGDGGYDTGMFSNGDGELQWFGNAQEVFSTTPNYFQLHKYIDMNGQNIDNLNQITFSDDTVQTTAYAVNSDQALYTTSSVQFQNLALGNGNITSDNALNLVGPYIGIVSTSTYDIDLYTNNFTADGVEVWLRHNDGVEINTANAVYNWKFDNTGSLRFPDGSLQVTAYTTNTDQALYTTSSVTFNALTVTNISLLTSLDGVEGSSITSTQFKAGYYLGGGYTFKNDAGFDTGMYSWGDGLVQFYANAQEIFNLNSDQIQLNKPIDANSQQINNVGQIQFGDSSVQTTAWTGTSHILANGNATVTLNSGGPLEFSPNTYISFDPPNPEGQTFYVGFLPGGEESATTSSFVYTNGDADFNISVNGNQWYFYRNGNLVLPNGGLITDSNDYNEGLVIKASAALSDDLHLVTTNTGTNIENTWTFTTDGGLMFPDTTVQTTAYTTATNGQTTIYTRNALPAGIPGMIITIMDSGSDTNSPGGNWAPAYYDVDAGFWTYIGNSNSVIAD